MSEPQGFPLWNQPFTDSRTGLITQAWRQFLLTLWQRSGGSSNVIIDVELLDTLPGGPAVDPTARKAADDAFMMALLAKSAADAPEGPETVYMPLGLADGRMALAPDGRPIPMIWGTL